MCYSLILLFGHSVFGSGSELTLNFHSRQASVFILRQDFLYGLAKRKQQKLLLLKKKCSCLTSVISSHLLYPDSGKVLKTDVLRERAL